jgi:hypothetical protein
MLSTALALLLVATPSSPSPSPAKQLIAAGVWAIPSFFLHTTIHEGSHALAAVAYGGQVTNFEVWPSTQHGNLTFGYTVSQFRSGDLADRAAPLIHAAPAITEAVWMIGAAIAYRNTDSEILKGMFLTEMLASLVDMTKWLFSAWSPNGDAHRYGEVMVPVGAIAIPIVALTAALIATH